MYKVPSDWQVYGVSGDQSTFALPGHTPQKPRLAIFDRKSPAVTSGGVSVPQMRVRFIEGVTDTDGNPEQTRCTIDATIRWPNIADPAKTQALMLLMSTLFGNVDYRTDTVALQLLPTQVSST